MNTPQTPRPRGFTLVEVLVALFVMALMAALTWRGVDGVLRGRDGSRAAVERTQRLSTLMQQWETDLQSLHRDAGVPALSFDGRTLRLVRRAPDLTLNGLSDGVQVVAWSLADGVWRRWTSATVTHIGDLRQVWQHSQQLPDAEPGQLALLQNVQGWQLYYFRGNAWTNAQSTGDSAGSPAGATELLPAAVRLQLQLGAGALTRDVMVGAIS